MGRATGAGLGGATYPDFPGVFFVALRLFLEPAEGIRGDLALQVLQKALVQMPAVREGGHHPDVVGGFRRGEPVHAGTGAYFFIAAAFSHGRVDRGIERGAQEF